MLQHLVILLDDTSVSYCHYENRKTERKPMPIEVLRSGIRYAMKQNLTIQFVYPTYELPAEYHAEVETIDHNKLKGAASAKGADVITFDTFADFEEYDFPNSGERIFVLRTDKQALFANSDKISKKLVQIHRLNIVLNDVETFSDADFDNYKSLLASLSSVLKLEYGKGRMPQLNLLTDRLQQEEMNNCNAGIENITLAPNGKFYICPAFYLENEADAVGNLAEGLDIKNRQLLKLEYAPLCRKCDAYQCKRCVWLNRKTTMEMNTPSHEQCVMAHLERNASRDLLQDEKISHLFNGKGIKQIDYLDPFDVREDK